MSQTILTGNMTLILIEYSYKKISIIWGQTDRKNNSQLTTIIGKTQVGFANILGMFLSWWILLSRSVWFTVQSEKTSKVLRQALPKFFLVLVPPHKRFLRSAQDATHPSRDSPNKHIKHLFAQGASNVCLVGKNSDELHLGVVGMQGSMVIRARPCMTLITPSLPPSQAFCSLV